MSRASGRLTPHQDDHVVGWVSSPGEQGRDRLRVVQCVLGELDQRSAIEDLGENLLSRRRKLPAPDHRGHDRAAARGRRRVLGQETGGGRRNRRVQVGPELSLRCSAADARSSAMSLKRDAPMRRKDAPLPTVK